MMVYVYAYLSTLAVFLPCDMVWLGTMASRLYRPTLGNIHAYVLPVKPDQLSEAGVRQQHEKLFYVSPFIAMAMRYHFRVLPPDQCVQLRILETDGDGPLLAATFNGRRRALNTRQLLRAFFTFPLVALKIMTAIHWEALRLWLKGARLVPRQNAAVKTSLSAAKSNDYTSPALPAGGRQ